MSYCVYKLTGENGLVYYGSTNNYTKGMWDHKTKPLNKDTSSTLLEGEIKFEVIEEGIPYRHIARIREGYYIRNFTCVNKKNPDGWFFKTFKKEYNKNWNNNNKDKRRGYEVKRYYKNKLEDKGRYAKNRGVKVKCECGLLVGKINLARHKKTKRHLSNVNTEVPHL